MILDLEPIFNVEGSVKDFAYEIDLTKEALDSDYPFTTPVSVKGDIHNRAGIVEIETTADFVLDICCDRCAKPLKYPYTVDINHTLVVSLNDDENDELILVDDVHQFNVDELVTDDIFLNLPAKFLCSEDCKGLCPKCGADLNEGACNCKKEIDPRLAALQQLLED